MRDAVENQFWSRNTTVNVGPVTYDLEFFDDPVPFLAAAGGLLAANPVESTVVATVTARFADEGVPDRVDGQPPSWWLVVRDGDRTVGAAMRTAPFVPFPVYLLAMPDDAAVTLAHRLHTRGEVVHAVHGAVPAVDVCAAELARLTGKTVRATERMRLQTVAAIVDPPLPRGELRAARAGDVDLVLAWFDAFGADAAEQAGSEDPHPAPIETEARTRQRIENGEIYVWEVDGRTVHMTAFNPESFGVVRVGPVYTPKEERGHGYAAAAVAEVSRTLLASGVEVCLFTDQANPTSNGLYERIGYGPVAETANLLVL